MRKALSKLGLTSAAGNLSADFMMDTKIAKARGCDRNTLWDVFPREVLNKPGVHIAQSDFSSECTD